MDTKQKALAREVFAQILLEPEHWDQGSWGSLHTDDARAEMLEQFTGPEYEDLPDINGMKVVPVTPSCGTAMCFAGWAAMLGDKGAKLLYDRSLTADYVLTGTGATRNIGHYASELLGIEDDTAGEDLFSGGNDIKEIFDILHSLGVFDVS